MTVLITGASQGIGLALALRYAREKHPLVLVARNSEKLMSVADECRRLSMQPVTTMLIDLSEHDAVQRILEQLRQQNITIDILINNAGFGLWGPFVQQPYAAMSSMIHVHIHSLIQLTQALLPNMLQQRQGQIINIGSLYSFIPVPEQSIYAATKAFLLSYSRSLAHELKNTGVHVTVVCPGATRTQFRSRSGISDGKNRFSMDADKVASITYAQAKRGKLVVIPGVINQLFIFVVTHIPQQMVLPIIHWINHTVRAIRKKPLDSV